MTTALRETPTTMEAAYLEYRRAGYEILRRHAAQRGVFDALERPLDEEGLSEALGFLPARRDVVHLFLQALVRYGSLETDGSRYWRSDRATDDAPAFDRDLMAKAIGKDELEALLHGDSYAGIVDTLVAEENKIGSAFVRANQQLWDEFLQTPFYSYFRDRAVEAVAAPGGAVLDLAAGPGFGLADLAGAVDEQGLVVGIDISRDFVAEAVERMRPHPRVRVLQADLDDGLPFLRQAYFDGAMLVGAYHFLRRRERFFETVASLLKPGGKLCVAYVYTSRGSLDQELMDLRLALREPIAHPTTDDELTELAAQAGLVARETFTIGCFGWYLLERS